MYFRGRSYKASLCCFSKSSLWNMEYVTRDGAFELPLICRTSTFVHPILGCSSNSSVLMHVLMRIITSIVVCLFILDLCVTSHIPVRMIQRSYVTKLAGGRAYE